jgi:hypothetical protein
VSKSTGAATGRIHLCYNASYFIADQRLGADNGGNAGSARGSRLYQRPCALAPTRRGNAHVGR